MYNSQDQDNKGTYWTPATSHSLSHTATNTLYSKKESLKMNAFNVK